MECLGSKEKRTSHLAVSGTRMTLVSDLHCIYFLRPRVSIPSIPCTQEASQRKGVNWKPFHANFETHFRSTHTAQTKIIHGICSIFSYSAGTRPYSNQNTKRFQFGSVAFSVLLLSANTTTPQIHHLPLFLPLTGGQDRACNRDRDVQTRARGQQQGVT